METPLVELAQLLRHNGLKLSTAELEDGARALSFVGLAEREQVRAALKATLVKREVDGAPFDRAFDLFFSGATRTLEALEASLLEQIESQGLLEGDERTMVLATLRQLLPSLTPLTRAMLQGNRGALLGLLRGASLQLDFSQADAAQAGFYGRRLLALGGGDGMRADLASMEAELRARGVAGHGIDVVSRGLGQALRDVEEAARREVFDQTDARRRREGSGLAVKLFSAFTPQDLALAQSAVRRLAQKLKSRMLRRRKTVRRRGQLHARATLRRNLGWDGVPMIPVFRSKRPERPDLVILCDLSDSVRPVSRLMLLFVHELQALFGRVRSFGFVSELGELTEAFRTRPLDEATELALDGSLVPLTGNSNYGHALATFARHHLDTVSRRTTVFLIGDGRNNLNAPQPWALEEIRRRSKRLLWLCPEDESAWGTGDSEMPLYARRSTQALAIRNLEDLSRLADLILPG